MKEMKNNMDNRTLLELQISYGWLIPGQVATFWHDFASGDHSCNRYENPTPASQARLRRLLDRPDLIKSNRTIDTFFFVDKDVVTLCAEATPGGES